MSTSPTRKQTGVPLHSLRSISGTQRRRNGPGNVPYARPGRRRSSRLRLCCRRHGRNLTAVSPAAARRPGLHLHHSFRPCGGCAENLYASDSSAKAVYQIDPINSDELTLPWGPWLRQRASPSIPTAICSLPIPALPQSIASISRQRIDRRHFICGRAVGHPNGCGPNLLVADTAVSWRSRPAQQHRIRRCHPHPLFAGHRLRRQPLYRLCRRRA